MRRTGQGARACARRRRIHIAPLNTARPVPNPAAPAQPRSYQRDYPRESTPLNPPSYRKHDLPGEWRD